MSIRTDLLWGFAGEAMQMMFASCPDFKEYHDDRFWWVGTGEPVADFNCAYISPKGNAPKNLEKVAGEYAKLGCPFLVCSPNSVAPKLQLTARKLGLVSIGELPLMARLTSSLNDAPVNSGIEIREIIGSEDFDSAVDIGSRTFGIRADVLARVVNPRVVSNEKIKMYMASFESTPASIVTATLHASAVGIWSMVTAPEFRKRGIASQLVRHVLDTYSYMPTCFLLATDQGRPLYLKAGFQIVEAAQVWCGGT